MIVLGHEVDRVAKGSALVRAAVGDLSVPPVPRPFVGAEAFLGLTLVELVVGEVQIGECGVFPQLVQVVQEPLAGLGALQRRFVQHLNLACCPMLHVVEAMNLLLALAVWLVHVVLHGALRGLFDQFVVELLLDLVVFRHVLLYLLHAHLLLLDFLLQLVGLLLEAVLVNLHGFASFLRHGHVMLV